MGCELTEADAEAEYVEIQDVQVSSCAHTHTHTKTSHQEPPVSLKWSFKNNGLRPEVNFNTQENVDWCIQVVVLEIERWFLSSGEIQTKEEGKEICFKSQLGLPWYCKLW